MISAIIKDTIYKITENKNLEQSLQVLLPDYLQLKLFFLKQEIFRYEMKWNMSYAEFEKTSCKRIDGFSSEIEQEYYEWGEKVALLQYYQNLKKAWT